MNFRQLPQEYQDLVFALEDRGMEMTAFNFLPEEFGNLYIELASPDLDVRLMRERGFGIIDVKSPLDRQWFGLELVMAHLEDEQLACQMVYWGEMKDFLLERFREIARLFAAEDFAGTRQRLTDLEEIRTKWLFG